MSDKIVHEWAISERLHCRLYDDYRMTWETDHDGIENEITEFTMETARQIIHLAKRVEELETEAESENALMGQMVDKIGELQLVVEANAAFIEYCERLNYSTPKGFVLMSTKGIDMIDRLKKAGYL